jgi:hypothetical protein
MNLNILTSKEFEAEIKELIKKKTPISMLDAVLLYCEQKNLEVETIASLVTPKMKSIIESDAIKERLFSKQKARLPIDD